MKLGTIINAIPALQRLAQCNLTLRTAYRIKKMLSAAEDEIEFFQEELRGIYSDTELTEKEKNAKTDALLELEVEVDFSQIEVSLGEDVRISPNDLVLLDEFIVLKD